jgi:G:T/U-mismatch repair DNA glycosylase
MSPRESHPHLHLFDPAKKWKYLIVGTFPPNSALREKLYIDYFYGNKGFLWKIIHDIYHDRGYDFFSGSMHEKVAEIKRWQNDYCVGLSDTVVSCRRKHPMSSNDSDLRDIQYNHDLKKYVLNNLSRIKRLIFTSTSGANSAFKNFKIIMGDDLEKTNHLLVTGLPSPSGAGNITFFNTNREETLGLTDDFYTYVADYRSDLLPEFLKRWELKKRKRARPHEAIVIPPSPAGVVTEFKLWKYREALPKKRCI